LEQWIETTYDIRVNDIKIIKETIDINPAIYMLYTWQWDLYQNMLYLRDELKANLYEIILIYLEKVQQILRGLTYIT